jgi:hypothetical protein
LALHKLKENRIPLGVITTLKQRWNEWYEIYGKLLLKAVLIPLVLIACACSGGILMLPVLLWLGRDRVMD